MKILQIIDVLNRGGAERVLVDLTNLLFARGHTVSVLTLLGEGPLDSDLHPDIKRLNLNRVNKYSLAKARSFIKTVNEYEVVHIHMRHVLRYYFFASLFFRVQAKVVFHDHWGDIEFDQSVPFHLRLLRTRIFYIGVSKRLQQWAENKVGFQKQRAFLLSNIVAVDFLEKKLTVPGARIVMIANFRRTKNIQFALSVVQGLSKYQSISLDIYGRDEDVAYLNELRLLTQTLGIKSIVRFVINKNARESLSNYNAAIHTASSETGPLVLIEYLAYQVPFLSYTTGEVATQIADAIPLYFKNDFNVDGWVDRMRQLLSGEQGYSVDYLKSLYNTHFSTRQYVLKCESIYQTIVVDEK